MPSIRFGYQDVLLGIASAALILTTACANSGSDASLQIPNSVQTATTASPSRSTVVITPGVAPVPTATASSEPRDANQLKCSKVADSPFDPEQVGDSVPLWQFGDQVTREVLEACRLAASAGGSHQGQYEFDYARALDVTGQFEAAVDHYKRALEAGHTIAAYSLATMSITGTGMKRDPKAAVNWYATAAKGGHPDGYAMLGIITLLSRGDLEQRAKEAARFFEVAADQHSSVGMALLGSAYRFGVGEPKDASKAAELYRQSIEAPNKRLKVPDAIQDAMYQLGFMLAKGDGVPKDVTRAKSYLDLSVGNQVGSGGRVGDGYVPAFSLLGYIEATGYRGLQKKIYITRHST
jgi:tetratricopeptide (TPR) repeat protein